MTRFLARAIGCVGLVVAFAAHGSIIEIGRLTRIDDPNVFVFQSAGLTDAPTLIPKKRADKGTAPAPSRGLLVPTHPDDPTAAERVRWYRFVFFSRSTMAEIGTTDWLVTRDGVVSPEAWSLLVADAILARIRRAAPDLMLVRMTDVFTGAGLPRPTKSAGGSIGVRRVAVPGPGVVVGLVVLSTIVRPARRRA